MLSCVLLLIALLSVAHAWSHRALQLDANSFEGSIHRMPNFFAFIFDSTKTTHLDTLDGAIARLFAEHPEAWSTCLIGAYDIGAPGNLQALDRVLPKLDVTSASTSSLKYLGTNTPKWSSTYKMDKDHLYDFILKRMKLAVAPTVIPKNEQENLPAHLRSMQVMEKVQYDYHRIHAMAQLAYNQPEKIDEILEEVEQWKDRIAADKQWGPLFANRTNSFHDIFRKIQAHNASFVYNETMLLSRILKATQGSQLAQLDQATVERLSDTVEVLRSFRERIPRVVHFIKTDWTRENFQLAHYLSIRSAFEVIKPTKIKFHCRVEPVGEHWKRLLSHVPVEIVLGGPTEMTWNGKKLEHVAHQSDSWRLEILIKEGGIYLDWDVLMLKPVDDLLSGPCVMGAEKKVPQMAEVLGVAVILARPRDPFLIRWRDEIRKTFNPTCYACHSVLLARNLALSNPTEVHALNWKAFYFPGWEADAANFMYMPVRSSDGRSAKSIVEKAFEHSYGIHLIESHENVKPKLLTLTDRAISEVDSAFNILVRKYL